MPNAELLVVGEPKEDTLEDSKILGSIGEAVIAIDKSGLITFMNDRAEIFLSCRRHDAIGRHLTEILSMVDDQPPSRTKRSLARVLRKGGRVDFMTSARCRAENGAGRLLESSAAPIKNPQDNITEAVLVCRDITECRQAEEDLRARARQQAVVAELGQRALAGTDLPTLLQEACVLVAQSLHVQYSKVSELEPDAHTCLLRAGVGWKEGLSGHMTADAGDNSEAGYVLRSSEPVIMEDLRKEKRFKAGPLLRTHEVVSGLSVIIPSPHRPFGILSVYTNQRRAFATEDVHFLQGVANVLAMAAEQKRAEESRHGLVEQVMSAQEAERRRIARELHDETGQLLTSLLVGLRLLRNAQLLKEAKAQAKYLAQITRQILDNLQRLARGLHPSILDDLGLVAGLTRYCADYAKGSGIAVHMQTEGLDSSRLPFPVETALYRIVQEALTNIAKHAAAKTVSITLRRQPSEIQATVHDDGCGFDVETTLHISTAAGHLGLYGMRERATLLGGCVTIESSAGRGTVVSVHLPLGD